MNNLPNGIRVSQARKKVAFKATAVMIVAAATTMSELMTGNAAPVQPAPVPIATHNVIAAREAAALSYAQKWSEAAAGALDPICVVGIKQGWRYMTQGRSVMNTPLHLGDTDYPHGIGTQADSEIHVTSAVPVKSFRARIGIDRNYASLEKPLPLARLTFSLETGGKQVWASAPITIDDKPADINVPLANVTDFTLKVVAADGLTNNGHADWVNAQVDGADGKTYWVGETPDEQRLPKEELFSFTYGGKSSDDLLPAWRMTANKTSLPDGVTLSTKTYHDPKTGLTVIRELKQFAASPAAEWVVRLRNDGTSDTPILENVLPMRLDWATTNKPTFLHRSHGSHGEVDDFRYQVDQLKTPEVGAPPLGFTMEPNGGRSSNDWMPYYNLQTNDSGVMVGIGWSGEWAAGITRDLDTVHLTAGLAHTHFMLHPGEEIRTPSIALVFWKGDPIDGNNNLRQFMLAYHTPHIAGKIATAPICLGLWGGQKDASLISSIKYAKDNQLKYDYTWVDAGWYGSKDAFSEVESSGKWYDSVGSWNPNPISHPNGMRPVSDAAHEAGMKFLLWFEPERAKRGSTLPTEHPDWFLQTKPEETNLLLNLGDPDALKGLTDLMTGWIKDYGVECLRQDFNFEPLAYWQQADAPDRVGITETKYVTGLYTFWDTLRQRYPSLLIDDCASGGRRLDFELVSRSIPLWRSDFPGDGRNNGLGVQLETLGLSYWLPLSGTTPLGDPAGDEYTFHGALSAAMQFGIYPPLPKGYSAAKHRAWMADFKRARPFYEGSYFPLTAYSTNEDVWGAYQMAREDLDAGIVVALRRPDCPYSMAAFNLKDLKPADTYEFEDADTHKTWRLTGKQLMEDGLPVTLDKKRSSALLFYRMVKQ